MAPDSETSAKRAELPMRLTRLRVKNFRSIADIDIPLSPLTVLVGPNGSGKSNVVDALRFVRDVFARGLDQAVMDREGVKIVQRWRAAGEGITIGVTAKFYAPFSEEMIEFMPALRGAKNIAEECEVNYDFTFSESAARELVALHESIYIDFGVENLQTVYVLKTETNIRVKLGKSVKRNESEKSWLIDKKIGNSLLLPEKLMGLTNLLTPGIFIKQTDESKKNRVSMNQAIDIGDRIDKLNSLLVEQLFYTLNPSDLRQPQQTLKESPFDEKGRNLAAVLKRLSRGDMNGWHNLILALRQAVAGFDDIEVEAVGGYLATKLIYQNDSAFHRTSYIGQESDGTIRMLGLLAALQQEPPQSLISIEEPEANIHPGALAVLAGVIEEASLRSQILVTTHSPDMLDHLPVESFLVVEKVGDTTHVGPLDASQMASVRKRLFTPGELFRMEGLQRQTEPESAS